MNSLEYRISPEIFVAHPDYFRGVVVVGPIDNRHANPDLEDVLRAAEEAVRESAVSNIAADPRVAAWREAFREFGAKPSEHRSSIEALIRRVVKGDQIPSINPLVDVGSIVSLRHVLPAGVHPLAGGQQVLELRRATADDTFVPAGSTEAECPGENEIVFTSGREVLTRRWCWRQAAATQTLPETDHVFFNVDGLSPVGFDGVVAAMRDIEELVMLHFGKAPIYSRILTRSNAEFSMAYG
ncbi:phenylalanine--tRNA ligase beta subunit-related protein [Paraburkholderia terrae]|uniref:B3/B4 domain-containing protein n=1 Tax=Paraburkholderia terrae TaxID=311230 RepID=UPI00336563D7